jgi:hypothetical protein
VFDSAFLSELEGLVAESGVAIAASGHEAAGGVAYRQTLDAFVAGAGSDTTPLTEEAFLALPPALLTERCNALIEACRRSARREAAQAVESFVVFFQTLVPTLGEEASREVKATFFRLVPTLVQVAWDDFGERADRREEGRLALQQLEAILLEVASVRLAPVESELLFRSLDQLAALISTGEYGLAKDVVSTPLLGILRKNRLTRSLFRLMEVEVSVQRYLKERLGHATPQIRLPEDVPALSDFGPVRIFDEEESHGVHRRYLQLQLPDIPLLSDIVVRLARADGSAQRELRLDGLGSVALDVPPGLYRIGLLYEPEGPRGG